METVRLLWRGIALESVVLPLALLVGLTMLLVSPVGNFPLNDDWAYAKQVRVLLLEHRFENSFMAMAFAQTVWGGLCAILFGTSHTVLRISTMGLALIAIWATARLALEAGLPRWAALLCAALVLGNPIFLNLSYTFMTDVPFMAPYTLAGLFYVKALKGDSWRALLAAGILAVTAASIRQFGVIIAGVYLLAELLLIFLKRRAFAPWRAAIFLAPWALGAAAYLTMPGLEGRPPVIQDLAVLSAGTFVRRMVYGVSAGLVYGGFFLLPLVLVRLAHLLRRRRAWSALQWACLPWVCLLVWLGTGRVQNGILMFKPMPILGNVLYNLGTGPLTLRDTLLWGMPKPVTLHQGWWWALTALSVLGVGILCADIVPPLVNGLLKRRPRTSGSAGEPPVEETLAVEVFLFLWAASVIAAPYHLLMSVIFDRYLIAALPPLVVLCARSLRLPTLRAAPAALATLCMLYALPSLAGVQDYLSWNRARWKALVHLRDNYDARPFETDGGYEYNSTFTRDAYLKATGANPHDWGKKGFWVIDDAFAVSFNPRDGYDEVARFPYFSWLGMTQRSILALRRQT